MLLQNAYANAYENEYDLKIQTNYSTLKFKMSVIYTFFATNFAPYLHRKHY